MVDVWWAPYPQCPVHGQMRHDFIRCAWTCAGFDGEGCDYEVTDEEQCRTVELLGTADLINLTRGGEWAPGPLAAPPPGRFLLAADPANPNIAAAFGQQEDPWTSNPSPE